MNKLPVFLGCFALACSSTSGNGEPDEIDVALLEHVTPSEYDAINAARATLAETEDGIAFARRERENAKRELALAKPDYDIAAAERERAEGELKLARENMGDAGAAAARLEDAHAYQRWADARIRHREARVEAAEVGVGLAEARGDLARSQVELAKARAVSTLDRPDAHAIDVSAYRRAVDRHEAEVADIQADLEAARTKVEYRRRLIDERAQAVPAQFRRDDELDRAEPARDGGAPT